MKRGSSHGNHPRRDMRARIWGLLRRMMKPVRRLYRTVRNRKLTNSGFTIISNDCTAAIIYHDLGHRFDSPTINLWIPNPYYFEFLGHLDYYIHAEPEPFRIDGVPYPVGRIRREDREILIHFMHYDSFAEARGKWIERAGRFHPDNLYILLNTSEPAWIEAFSQLEFPRKVMLTRCDASHPPRPDVIDLPVFHRSTDPGIALLYKPRFSLQRWLDDFDYISFLNRKS